MTDRTERSNIHQMLVASARDVGGCRGRIAVYGRSRRSGWDARQDIVFIGVRVSRGATGSSVRRRRKRKSIFECLGRTRDRGPTKIRVSAPHCNHVVGRRRRGREFAEYHFAVWWNIARTQGRGAHRVSVSRRSDCDGSTGITDVDRGPRTTRRARDRVRIRIRTTRYRNGTRTFSADEPAVVRAVRCPARRHCSIEHRDRSCRNLRRLTD